MSSIEWVFEQGGWVSVALAIVSVLLWAAVMIRMFAVWPAGGVNPDGSVRGRSVVASFVRHALHMTDRPGRLDQLVERTKRELGTMRGFIATLVAIAPLLGLLGTVIGMVEMFGSLEGATGSNGEITVAGGISTALVTTQLGLVIAAPGLIVAYWLTRQQLRREREINDVVRSLQREAQ